MSIAQASEPTLSKVSRPGKKRLIRVLLGVMGAATLLYAALLVPEPKGPILRGAGKHPFIWKQDALWAQLETGFAEARSAQRDSLTGRMQSVVTRIDEANAKIAASSRASEDPVYRDLEKAIFEAAPLFGAAPELWTNFATRIVRTRDLVKRQSQQWDLKADAVRQRLYRLLWGSRMALEEVMLQIPPQDELPPVMLCTEEPSQTPETSLLGVKIHSGDILVSRGGAPTSALIARGNDYPGSFSHVALVQVDERTGKPSVIESHIERGVVISSMEEYLADEKLRIMLLRLRADLPAMRSDPMLPHKAATSSLTAARQRHIPYDFTMDYRDHSAQFCSEVASAAYEQKGIQLWSGVSLISSQPVIAWLGSLGVRHFETQEPADLEYDPQLRVVAEWRERSTLFKSHLDDAVTDVMLERAKGNEALGYPIALLPFARVSKAYSFLLNAIGRTGPIPEGMSATTALRVKKYQADHLAIAKRVLVMTDEFHLRHGYPPPYWQLLDLARNAADTSKGAQP